MRIDLKALLVLALLVMTIPAYGAISLNEESYVKTTLAYEQLKDERVKLIAERDALLLAEDAKCNSAKDAILETYELTIDNKESEINAKLSELNSIITAK